MRESGLQHTQGEICVASGVGHTPVPTKKSIFRAILAVVLAHIPSATLSCFSSSADIPLVAEETVERFSISSLNPALLDLHAWPIGNLDKLAERELSRYEARQRAVELVVRGESAEVIRSKCRMSKQMAVYLLRRCLQVHPDGKIYGFRILIPFTRAKAYLRTADVLSSQTSAHALSGAFNKLLREYPDIRELLDRHILKIRGKEIYESRVQLKSLHKRFLDKCREFGLDVGKKYPFNTVTMGHRSLSNYIHRTIRENIERATAANFGPAAVKTLATGDGSRRPIFHPFERGEADAHRIDAIFTILIPSVFGNVITKTVDRLWVIVLKDVASGVVLAHYRSCRAEVNGNDLLAAVARALQPWEPCKLQIPTLKYRKGAGYPSNVDPRFVAACWEELSVDGALAETGGQLTAKIKRAVGASTVTLSRTNPNDRPFIERFFGMLEQNGFHRLPNTTGSHSKDTRRNKPEQVAHKYQMQVEHLDELLDVMHANYNATPKRSLGERTPLEYLQYLCESQTVWPHQAEVEEVQRLLMIRREVVVRGSISHGVRPHINFAGAKYTSDVLRQAMGLIGKKIVIEIPHDIRTVRAYTLDNADLGPLSAAPPWNRSAHTWEVRRAIQAQFRNHTLHYVEGSDPIIDYLKYLEEAAHGGKSVSPLYLSLRQMLTDDWTASNQEDIQSVPPKRRNRSIVSQLEDSRTGNPDLQQKEVIAARLFRKVING